MQRMELILSNLLATHQEVLEVQEPLWVLSLTTLKPKSTNLSKNQDHWLEELESASKSGKLLEKLISEKKVF